MILSLHDEWKNLCFQANLEKISAYDQKAGKKFDFFLREEYRRETIARTHTHTILKLIICELTNYYEIKLDAGK